MGRTHYFVTSSDGSILYPPNHYTIAKTSKESIFKATYGGWKGNHLRVIDSTHHLDGVKESYYDPTGMDTSPTSAVTTISVAGSNTDAGIFVVNQGGRNNNESGSIGKK